MQKTRIAIYPGDGGGCGSYRLIWPGLAVAEQFKDMCEVFISADAPRVKLKWKNKFEGSPPEWAELIDAEPEFDVDVLVFQRPLHKESIDAFRILRSKGYKVIVDLDDNFDRIDSKNAAWFSSEPGWHHKSVLQQYANKYGKIHIRKVSMDGEWHYIPEYVGRSSRTHIHASLKHADLLTCSTPHIQESYKNSVKNSLVLRNCVPERYLNVERAVADGDQSSTLGWTGTLATHPDDFRSVGGAINQSKRKNDYTFKIIGYGEGIRQATGVEPDVVTGWVDISDYPTQFATLDIAICPLNDTKFNDSKSWLKPLEAASVGAVPIMSPTPEYVELNKLGIGMLASKPREWESAINKLVKNPELVKEMSLQGRSVAAKLTIEANAHKWFEAWSSV